MTNRNAESLYHYTDVHGLVGIIQSESLRATRCNFLNDASEVSYALATIRDSLEDHRAKQIPHYDVLRFAVTANLSTFESIGIYITSLSRRRDSLELWKNYADNGGYCLEFIRESIVGQISDRSSFFCVTDIVYDRDRQVDITLEKLRHWSTHVEQYCPDARNRLDKKGGIRFDDIIDANELLSLTLMFKNNIFAFEEECRFVFLIRDDNKFSNLELQLRTSNGIVIPFVQYPLNDNMSSLHSIMLGPLNNSQAAEDGLRMLLIKKKWAAPIHYPQPLLNNVAIEKSVCPLRF